MVGRGSSWVLGPFLELKNPLMWNGPMTRPKRILRNPSYHSLVSLVPDVGYLNEGLEQIYKVTIQEALINQHQGEFLVYLKGNKFLASSLIIFTLQHNYHWNPYQLHTPSIS